MWFTRKDGHTMLYLTIGFSIGLILFGENIPLWVWISLVIIIGLEYDHITSGKGE